MSDNKTYLEQVGAYLDGELIGDELTLFESELNSNQSLSSEVELQKELIEGIKAARKAELIARLENIPISSGAVSTGVLTKFIAGALILGGIGFGTYQFIKPEPQETIVEKSLNPVKEIEEKIQDPIPSGKVEEKTETKSDDTTPNQSKVEEENEQVVIKDETEFIPEIIVPVVPDPSEVIDNVIEEDLEIPKAEIGTPDISENSTMEVEIVKHRRFTFHYQVKGGKLILYGKFNEEPYQIIEINVNKEKQWYLYFKENYYSIDKDMSDITPLVPLTNESLVEELEKRKNEDF